MNMHLTKSQIGLDGVARRRDRVEPCRRRARRTDHRRRARRRPRWPGELRERHRTALERRDRQDGHRSRCAGPARRRAPARVCTPAAVAAGDTRDYRSSTVFAPPSPGCAPRAGSIMRPPSSAHFRSSRARWCSKPKANAPIAPDPNVSHAADTLKMLLGERPEPRNVAALDAYFVTVCDHGMNASTFTTRVVASTQADLFAAVTAGYCALTGPLHGGAPEPVLEMLDAIGTRERIKPWVDDALARGERLMGFGHRVYRVRDPRADVLKAAIERLVGRRRRPALCQRGRGLHPRSAAAEESEPAAGDQCRILHGDPARRAGHSRGRRSRRSSRSRAPPAGPRMRGSSSAPAG